MGLVCGVRWVLFVELDGSNLDSWMGLVWGVRWV